MSSWMQLDKSDQQVLRSLYTYEGQALLEPDHLVCALDQNRPMMIGLADGEDLSLTCTRSSQIEVVYRGQTMLWSLDNQIVWFGHASAERRGELSAMDWSSPAHQNWYKQAIWPYHLYTWVMPVSQTQIRILVVINQSLVDRAWA
jgi:hypothetical protein